MARGIQAGDRPPDCTDRRGTVRHVFSSMTNIGQHVSDALEIVRQLQAEQPAQ